MRIIFVSVLALSTALSDSIFLERAQRARCYRETDKGPVRHHSFCYLPLVCAAGRQDSSRILYLPRTTRDDLVKDQTAGILQSIWSYGPDVKFVEDKQLREEYFPTDAIVDAEQYVVFFSTVSQGAAHYGPHTAFPVIGLSDPEVRAFLNIPRITHVWQLVFEERQHLEEMWIKDLVALLRRKFGIVTMSGTRSLFRTIRTSKERRSCFRAIMYDGKNLGDKRDRPLHYFMRNSALRSLQSMVFANDRTCRDPERKSKTLHISLVQRRSKTRRRGLATRRLADAEELAASIQSDAAFLLDAADDNFVDLEVDVVLFEDLPSVQEQAAVVRRADVLISPHGNGLMNLAFMRPCSSVVEIFPANFRYIMFDQLANQSSIVYRFVQIDEVTQERGAPQCLIESSTWRNLTPDACFEDAACRTCTRSAPFVRVKYRHDVRSRLESALRQRSQCLERLPPIPAVTPAPPESCRCPEGTFVAAGGNIFYCDGPRLLRVTDWDVCVAVGDACARNARPVSEACAEYLGFSGL
eukprot:g8.t1